MNKYVIVNKKSIIEMNREELLAEFSEMIKNNDIEITVKPRKKVDHIKVVIMDKYKLINEK